MKALRQAWRRLGSPDAISWVLLTLNGIQQFAGAMVAPFTDISGRVGEFLGLRLLALLATFAVLGLGKLLLLRFARVRPKPFLTLTILLTATTTTPIVTNWLLIVFAFTDEWTLLRRLLVAIPGSFSIFLLSAILVTHARDLARQNVELATVADELVATREKAAERIEQRRDDLVRAVRAEVRQALSALRRTTDAKDDPLKKLIDDVVRLMSYRLSREIDTYEPQRTIIPETRPSWQAVVTAAMRGNPAHPVATTVWIGLLVGMFLITGEGLAGVFGVLTFAAVSFSILSLARLVWGSLSPTHSTGFRIALYSLFVIAFSGVSAPAMEVTSGYSFTAPLAFTGWVMLSIFMTWTVTLVFAVNDNLRTTFAELTLTVDELKREVIQLNGEFRMLQKRVSRVLHGPVQEAISASIHRLQSIDAAERQAELIEELRSEIENALELLNNADESAPNLDIAFHNLVELWDELVEITIDLSDNARTLLESDPATSSGLIELVREACANAMKHGDAKHIQVAIRPGLVHDTIDLVVENDGTPLGSEGRAGLGSQIFTERCLSWSRMQVGSLVRLEAQIPLHT